MISGLNQEIDLLGKTFHFQTELSDQNGLSIRTEVFLGGKVVATRESRIHDGAGIGSDEAIRGRMKELHSQAITTFVARARRFQLRTPEGVNEPWEELAADPPAAAEPAAEPPAPKLEPPPAVVAPEVADAIKVRRFFGQYRQVVGSGRETPEDLKKRLAKTAQTLTWMIRSELFAEIRMDEQARCHLLKEQIDEWLMGGCDPWRGAQIWSNAVTFSDYLAEINLRTELVAHDQKLLIWALGEVQTGGMTGAVRDRIGALYGRHPRLDRLLDGSDSVANATWTAHLRSVLTLL